MLRVVSNSTLSCTLLSRKAEDYFLARGSRRVIYFDWFTVEPHVVAKAGRGPSQIEEEVLVAIEE